MVGILLLFVILTFSLTGYLLPWDTKAYWATSVTIKIMGSAPILGPLLEEVLQGGPTLGSNTLQRFFTIHVFLLPAAVTLLMYVHFRLIRKHGISQPL
jgi:menaquinol-cytochrome c reductase cytochrome b subunit